MKYNFNSLLLYSIAFSLLLSISDAFAAGKGPFIKKRPPKTQHQVTERLQTHLTKQKVDFSHPYPDEWNKLPVIKFFFRLQDEEHPSAQFVVDWCNGMVNVFEDPSCKKDINEITLARAITLLGQKAKQDKQIKVILQKYFSEKPNLMKYWEKETIKRLKEKQFDQQALANIFYGHALLGLKPNEAFYEAWKGAALSRLKSTDPKEQFNQQALANIFYGHALLGLKPNAALYEAWKNGALSRLKSTDPKKQFDQQALANIFYGHALLGLKPNAALYEAWENAALSRLTSTDPKEQFNQQHLANIFYGHAQLGLKPNEALYEAWEKASLSRLTSKNPKEQFNQQELANIFYGHALLGLKPNEALYKAWENAALSRLSSKNPKGQFNQQELANIFYGHALLGLKPNEALYKAWENAALSRLKSTDPKKQFDQQALANIFYGHALLGLKPNAALYEAWENAALSRLKSTDPKEQFNQQALVNIFYGHALLGLKPNAALYEVWNDAALSRLKSTDPKEQFNQQTLANIFYGHAQLGLKPNAALYEAWNDAALSRLKLTDPKEQFDQQHLANIFYGHALLGLKPNATLYEAWNGAALSRLKSTDPKEQFSQKELHSIYLTMKRFALKDLLRENFPQVSLIKTLKAKAPKRSKLQSDVSQSLQEYLGTTHVSYLLQEEYWVDDIASQVDIFLAPKGASKGIPIEVDGPRHFFPGTREYKPKNKLREEILNQTHKFTKLVRIPYYEWDELHTVESKSKYLEGKLSLSLVQTVQTDSPEIKEQETKLVKHGAKKSSPRAGADSFTSNLKRTALKTKLSSKGEYEEKEQKLPSK